MKIVYFIPNLIKASGMERVLCVKANYLAELNGGKDYKITIITHNHFDQPIFFDFSPKINIIHFNIKDSIKELHQYRGLERSIRYRKFISTYRQKVEDYLMNNPTDIAISMGDGAEHSFLPLIKDGSKKIIEFHFNFKKGPFKRIDEKLSLYNIRDKYHLYRLKKIYQKYEKIITLTKADEKIWQKYFDNTTTIKNPITITPLSNPPLQNKRALAVGRLAEQKGFDYLIDAWKIVNEKHPDWSLDIFGDGELKQQLLKQIERNNLQGKIIIHQPTKEIEKTYNEHSIFVLSSRFEGFVLAIIEAMASGIPCVSFDCEYGPRQIINHGENGFLTPLENVEQLAQHIIKLIENEDLRKEFSQKAVISAQRFSLDKIMIQWKELFSNLSKSK